MSDPRETPDPNRELATILDDLSYELTRARSAGFAEPDTLRAALRRATQLAMDADALVASETARRSVESD